MWGVGRPARTSHPSPQLASRRPPGLAGFLWDETRAGHFPCRAPISPSHPTTWPGFLCPRRNGTQGGATDLHSLYPLGQITDEGDTVLQVRRLVKGRRVGFQLHDGTERDTVPADRIPNSTPAVPTSPERINTVRDLAEDKKFTRTYAPVDEFGVPSVDPFDGTQAFTTANPELLNVTDNGDGSAVIAAVGGGALGPAALTFTATPTNGNPPIVKDDTINVVAGAAEGFAATDSADEEVTADA